jgi:hypothetical protein
MAHIKIRRRWQYTNCLRSYIVELDGARVGKIKNNSEVELQAAPGPHSLQVRISWWRSKMASFSIAGDDETAMFECGTVNPFLAAFYAIFMPRHYLWLRPIPA